MLNRRDFIKTATGTTAGLLLSESLWAQDANLVKKASDRLGEILPQRALGSTGQNVTILGMGGHHMVQLEEKQSQAVIEMPEAGNGIVWKPLDRPVVLTVSPKISTNHWSSSGIGFRSPMEHDDPLSVML